MQALQKDGQKKRTGRPWKYKTNAARQRAYRKRLKRSVHFRSDTHLWSTPQALFDELNAEFGFTIGVCALPENAKCAVFYSPEQDGLQQEWSGVVWCNPPYGRAIAAWVQKAYQSAQSGALVVCLLPARCDTRWWHTYVLPWAEVRYLKGRLKFGGTENSAPFPSAVVIFRPVASVAGADQRLLERLRWGKWTLAELQWVRAHLATDITPEVIKAIDAKIIEQSHLSLEWRY